MRVKIVHDDGYSPVCVGTIVRAIYEPQTRQYLITGTELNRVTPQDGVLRWYDHITYTFSESAIEPLPEFSYISSHRIGDRVIGLGEVEELRITDKGVYAVMVRMSPTGAKRRKIYKLEEL